MNRMARVWEKDDYSDSGNVGWEAYGDFEIWLKRQMPEDLADKYEEIDGTLQCFIYAIFCRYADSQAGCANERKVKNEVSKMQ